MAITDITTRSSADTNASADINTLNTNDQTLAEEQPNGYNNLVVDGDFNHANAGITTTSSAAEYMTDVWWFKGTAGDWSLTTHATTVSKTRYLNYTGSVSYANAQIRQNIKGNCFSGKTISVFLRLKAPSASPTTLQIEILADGSSAEATSPSFGSITTGWVWYRVDITVPAYSVTNYTQIRVVNKTTETFNLDIDKVRFVEKTDNLPDSVIPEWVKKDECAECSIYRTVQYYRKRTVYISATTGERDILFDVPMIQSPTITYSDGGWSTVASSNSEDGYIIARGAGGATGTSEEDGRY